MTDSNNAIPSWTFRTYASRSGRCEVEEWYDSLTPKAQAKVLVRLEYLAQQPRSGWQRPHFAPLHGECSGLYEVRCKVEKVEVRLIGNFGPNRQDFTLLLVAEERGGKFRPPSSCSTAQDRWKELKIEPERAHEWKP
ncbi:type II toxin-antitoxin system RelE/ParE family toxin [Pelagibius marinus]|uniref:type II toxin-antitoxin system RelE/ParE family toxin n=1 Tax=Pelagibius marinus TaxID=2762760 RepID=UPI001873216B|nr:type II toxin-antitoxin system RelE/ParE family toxin [Pelagibius marinus]